jgi:hypothetical protein
MLPLLLLLANDSELFSHIENKLLGNPRDNLRPFAVEFPGA